MAIGPIDFVPPQQLTVGAYYNLSTFCFDNPVDPPYVWSISVGALPPGLAIGPNLAQTQGSAGSIVGTPTTAGTFNFTLTCTDNGAHVANLPTSLTIGSTPQIFRTTQKPPRIPDNCLKNRKALQWNINPQPSDINFSARFWDGVTQGTPAAIYDFTIDNGVAPGINDVTTWQGLILSFWSQTAGGTPDIWLIQIDNDPPIVVGPANNPNVFAAWSAYLQIPIRVQASCRIRFILIPGNGGNIFADFVKVMLTNYEIEPIWLGTTEGTDIP